MAGLDVVSADDLDEALVWAEKVVEAVDRDIEVRPFRATRRLQAGAGH